MASKCESNGLDFSAWKLSFRGFLALSLDTMESSPESPKSINSAVYGIQKLLRNLEKQWPALKKSDGSNTSGVYISLTCFSHFCMKALLSLVRYSRPRTSQPRQHSARICQPHWTDPHDLLAVRDWSPRRRHENGSWCRSCLQKALYAPERTSNAREYSDADKGYAENDKGMFGGSNRRIWRFAVQSTNAKTRKVGTIYGVFTAWSIRWKKKFTCSPFRLVAFIDTTEKNGMPTTTITLGGNVIVVDVSYQDIFWF